MATHSSVLAWRIPGTGEPGGLLSMGSHRVGHDWSDLAVAAITPKRDCCVPECISWFYFSFLPSSLPPSLPSFPFFLPLTNFLFWMSLMGQHHRCIKEKTVFPDIDINTWLQYSALIEGCSDFLVIQRRCAKQRKTSSGRWHRTDSWKNSLDKGDIGYSRRGISTR